MSGIIFCHTIATFKSMTFDSNPLKHLYKRTSIRHTKNDLLFKWVNLLIWNIIWLNLFQFTFLNLQWTIFAEIKHGTYSFCMKLQSILRNPLDSNTFISLYNNDMLVQCITQYAGPCITCRVLSYFSKNVTKIMIKMIFIF